MPTRAMARAAIAIMRRQAARTTYQIAAVARLTGLSVDTIRAWERRYALVEPPRDETGIRQYDQAHVARLELARAATEQGHPIRRVAAMSDRQLTALLGERPRKDPGRVQPLHPRSAEDLVGDLLDAVRNYEVERAKALLASAALLLTGEDFVLSVLAPLLRAIGSLWEEKRLSIAQEHFISQLVRDFLGSLTRLRRCDREPSMLFATPPQEPHEFGIALAACLASLRGIKTCVLGPNVPVDEVLRAARFVHPKIVVIGTSLGSTPSELARYLGGLDARLPRRTELWIGGAGIPATRPAGWPKRVQFVATLIDFAHRLASCATA